MQAICPHCHATVASNLPGTPVQCSSCRGQFISPQQPQQTVPTIHTKTVATIRQRTAGIEGLFDFGFRSVATPTLIKWLYAVITVLTILFSGLLLWAWADTIVDYQRLKTIFGWSEETTGILTGLATLGMLAGLWFLMVVWFGARILFETILAVQNKCKQTR